VLVVLIHLRTTLTTPHRLDGLSSSVTADIAASRRSPRPGVTSPDGSSATTTTGAPPDQGRVEHVIARLKDWQILRQCRRRGAAINHSLHVIAGLWNLKPTPNCGSTLISDQDRPLSDRPRPEDELEPHLLLAQTPSCYC
jgi:hypothetical protein